MISLPPFPLSPVSLSLSFLPLINCRSILALRSGESRSGNSLPGLFSHLFLPDRITLISLFFSSRDYAFLFFRSSNRVTPRVISSLFRSSCSIILDRLFFVFFSLPFFCLHFVLARDNRSNSLVRRLLSRGWNSVTARMIYRAGNRVHGVTRL